MNAQSRDGETALHLVLRDWKPQDANKVLGAFVAAGASLAVSDKAGNTPLHLAADIDADVQVLISAGAAVNVTNKSGSTPLHFAKLKRVIAAGADPNARDSARCTPAEVVSNRTDRKHLARWLRYQAATAEMRVLCTLPFLAIFQ